MHELNYPETTKWVLAHNGENIYHTSVVKPQNCFVTGQPFMEIFDSEQELLAAHPNLSSYQVETYINDYPPLSSFEEGYQEENID
jgi:hypothetical protein